MRKIHLLKEPSLIAKYDAFQYQKEAFEAVKDLEYAAIFHEQTATDKNRISSDLTIARRSVLQSNVSDESGTYYQDIAFDELDMLIGKMKGITTFKAINTLEGLTNTEKRILEKVFTAILASNASNASAIIDQILLSFTKENKN